MSKRFLSIVVFILLCLGARAQVFVLNDNILTQRMGEIRASVVDSPVKHLQLVLWEVM